MTEASRNPAEKQEADRQEAEFCPKTKSSASCTKKVCYGGGDCFNARKKERKEKETTK